MLLLYIRTPNVHKCVDTHASACTHKHTCSPAFPSPASKPTKSKNRDEIRPDISRESAPALPSDY